MDHAVAEELGLFQAGDHPKDPFLLAAEQMGLEAHHVIELAFVILPAELHHGVGHLPGAGVDEAHGL